MCLARHPFVFSRRHLCPLWPHRLVSDVGMDRALSSALADSRLRSCLSAVKSILAGTVGSAILVLQSLTATMRLWRTTARQPKPKMPE